MGGGRVVGGIEGCLRRGVSGELVSAPSADRFRAKRLERGLVHTYTVVFRFVCMYRAIRCVGSLYPRRLLVDDGEIVC